MIKIEYLSSDQNRMEHKQNQQKPFDPGDLAMFEVSTHLPLDFYWRIPFLPSHFDRATAFLIYYNCNLSF